MQPKQERYHLPVMYLIKTPPVVKRIFSQQIWSMPVTDKVIYLTFDDGPTPGVTTGILDVLKQYNAKATFFLLGKNVEAHPELFDNIVATGHTIGNHTFNHLNGWKAGDVDYLRDIYKCLNIVPSRLFRPPYGKITTSQARRIRPYFKVVMWDVISGDFDQTLSNENCLTNVTDHAVPGSVVVFHDSIKAKERMEYALPRTLEFFSKLGYRFESLPQPVVSEQAIENSYAEELRPHLAIA